MSKELCFLEEDKKELEKFFVEMYANNHIPHHAYLYWNISFKCFTIRIGCKDIYSNMTFNEMVKTIKCLCIRYSNCSVTKDRIEMLRVVRAKMRKKFKHRLREKP